MGQYLGGELSAAQREKEMLWSQKVRSWAAQSIAVQAELQQCVSFGGLFGYFGAEQALVANPYTPAPCTHSSREEADGDLRAEGSIFSLISLLLWKISSGKNLLPPFKVPPSKRKGKINS